MNATTTVNFLTPCTHCHLFYKCYRLDKRLMQPCKKKIKVFTMKSSGITNVLLSNSKSLYIKSWREAGVTKIKDLVNDKSF